MQFSKTSVLLSLLPFTLAQDYGSGDNAEAKSNSTVSGAGASTTASSSGVIHKVKVGDGGLNFSPNNLKASVGDSIEFHFFPTTHSVAQSSFAAPCKPLNEAAFFSGGFKTASGENEETFTITVSDSKPIWFYCGFPGHCTAGMAGVINPPADGSKTIEQYVAAAANVSNPSVPTKVQGGTLGPAKAPSSGTKGNTKGNTTASNSSPSSASSKSSGNAALEVRGGVSLTMFILTGLAAMAFGGLI